MKRKTGAQEHTIIIGTILASIVVFVLGFFLGRVWVLMPQEKMVKEEKTIAPAVSETEEELEFEETLTQLKEQKIKEELKREKEAKEKVKRTMEEEEQKETEEKLALLKERQEEERKKELEKKRKKEALMAEEKERELTKMKEEKQKEEKELDKKRQEEQKRKLEAEEKRKREQEAQKALEAKRKVMMEEKSKAEQEKPKPVEEKHTPPPTLAEGEYFTLQLQSSPNRERVEDLLTQLRAQGYAAYINHADLKEKGIWYRIRLGKYTTQEEAIKDGERLKSKGIISQYWITKNK